MTSRLVNSTSQPPQMNPRDALTLLYTKVDAAQCDKLATVVGRTQLTTLATVDVPCRNFSKSRDWDKASIEILKEIGLALFWIYSNSLTTPYRISLRKPLCQKA